MKGKDDENWSQKKGKLDKLTLAIMACFVDAGLTTLSSLTPVKRSSSSIRPSERAVRTLCSMRLTSLYRRFLDADGLAFAGDEGEEGIVDDDKTAAAEEDEPAVEIFFLLGDAFSEEVEEAIVELCGTKSNAASRVFNSCSSRPWVAKTEHFLHTQSFRISSRVYSSKQSSKRQEV